MSLDVYLKSKRKTRQECACCGSVYSGYKEYYSANITHNLTKMAEEAGIYQYLWHPEKLDIKFAKQLIGPLTEGLEKLKNNPKYYEQFNSENGWGLYIHFVPFVENYLKACIENPESRIEVSI
jgi:hypothetical protein